MIGEIVHLNGTTTSVGIIVASKTLNYNPSDAFVLSNVSAALAKPYSITIDNITSTEYQFRVRNMGDNSVVANTAIDARVLVVGLA